MGHKDPTPLGLQRWWPRQAKAIEEERETKGDPIVP